MASTISSPLFQAQSITLQCVCNAQPIYCKALAPRKPASLSFNHRRQLLFLSPALVVRESPSLAEDIPLFGLRKKLKKAGEEAEELVREGFEAAEKGLESAERGILTVERKIESAEKGIETAEKEIEGAVSFGALQQAGVVAGAEAVGVLVATSVVGGILGPEAQKS